MKNRKGYISIIAIIVMSVSIIMILQIITIVKMQIMMLNSSVNKIQSNYYAEDKILMSIYDEKYYTGQFYPVVLDVFRKNNLSIIPREVIIEQSDLNVYDKYNKVELDFQDKNNRKELELKTQSNYKDIQTSVKGNLSLVNRLFEMDKIVLDMNTIENKYKEELEAFLINVEENITTNNTHKPDTLYATELYDFNSISLKKINSKVHNLICTRDSMENPYIEGFDKREIFLVIKEHNNEKVRFYIDSKENLIKLSGIIYVEGDLIVSGEFVFNGIIVIKNGDIIVNCEKKPIINGMIILSNSNMDEEIEVIADLNRSMFLVYKYGTFLPGFLDVNLNLIKNSE